VIDLLISSRSPHPKKKKPYYFFNGKDTLKQEDKTASRVISQKQEKLF